MAGPPSSRSSRSSFPSASGEPGLRRLGVGGSGGGDRPVRAQIVVALVVALILVAVPLYLMRRPSPEKKTLPDAGVPTEKILPAPSSRPEVSVDAGKALERIKLAPPQRVRCGARPRGGQEGNLCDQQAALEEAFAKTIRDNATCAPRVKEGGTINFVLNVDFDKRALHVFPGASGDFRGPAARRAAACIKRALPKPDWESLRHQYRYYTIAILTTYLPQSALTNPSGTPRFD